MDTAETVETTDTAPNPNGSQASAEETDSMQLLASGNIRFSIDGRTYKLRRPRIGEYRALREAIDRAREELALSESTDDTDQMIEWVRQVFVVLSDRPMTAQSDDWPTWMIGPQFAVTLITHWRDLPLAPGRR